MVYFHIGTMLCGPMCAYKSLVCNNSMWERRMRNKPTENDHDSMSYSDKMSYRLYIKMALVF